jgi:2-hydroxycyclohexanecarboxyl-CoA dehydrogenase
LVRVAIVTGSASGIGLATARLAASRGFAVIGLDLAAERPDTEAAAACDGATLHADVTDPDAVADAVARAARVGEVVVAVSAAGILTEVALAEVSAELASSTIRVHLGGLFNLTQACAEWMRPGGAILAVSSELVAVGAPDHAHYVTAKAGVEGFVRAAARELASAGIRINGVAPGPVDTPLLGSSGREPSYVDSLPLRRLGRPEELAHAILDVASWSWATGAIVAVNGGAVIRA